MNTANRGLLDEEIIRRAVHTIKPDGGLFEVRIFGSRKKGAISGYFTDADTLVKAFDTVDIRGKNAYIVLNTIKGSCYSRRQRDHFEQVEIMTGDNDIETFDWLFIDMDPVRTIDVSSSKEELDEAIAMGARVKKYLEGLGFERPIEGLSGNGMHLLYRIGLANTQENEDLIERCLNKLSKLFTTDMVKIDTVNYNPSRICKLYGTAAQKGSNTPERPHRISEIISEDFHVRQTMRCYLEKLAGDAPEEKPTPARYNNYNPNQFNLVDWMQRHGLEYTERGAFSDGGRKFVLSECPFNPQHKAPDSMLVLQPDGAIAFKCFHNSCQDKTWEDVWRRFDPGLYEAQKAEEDRRIEEGWRRHNANRTDIPYEEAVLGESAEPVFLSADMIADKPEEVRVFIRTGNAEVDYKTKGLEKGTISLVSGLRGGGKSTLLAGWMLNAINAGNTVVCYSGELSDRNFLRWMVQQAAGKAHTIQSDEYEDYYTVDKEISLKVARWIGQRLWLYNNNYGNNYQKVYDLVSKQVKETKADMVVIDNIMSLDLSASDRDKYESQTKFIWMLKDLARLTQTHVIFVAHPRKSQGFLRLDDVSGSGNIGNIVDNAFIVHRNNEDFKVKTKEYFKFPADWQGYAGTNVIEICKNRDNGKQDVFIPLWYEVQTKRLKGHPAENLVYGWDEDRGFTPVYDVEVPFEK